MLYAVKCNNINLYVGYFMRLTGSFVVAGEFYGGGFVPPWCGMLIDTILFLCFAMFPA